MAALLTPTTLYSGSTRREPKLVMPMMRPQLFFCMYPAAAWAPKRMERALTLSVQFQPFDSCSTTGFSTPDAALPMKMSTPPNASAAACTSRCAPSVSPTCALTTIARPPAASMSAAVCSARSRCRIVVHGHIRAVTGQFQRDRAADPAAAAGDRPRFCRVECRTDSSQHLTIGHSHIRRRSSVQFDSARSNARACIGAGSIAWNTAALPWILGNVSAI